MAKKKVVLVLVEGFDEIKILEKPLNKIFNDNRLQMRMTCGDVFLQDDINHTNVKDKINEQIVNELNKRNFSKDSVSKIFHIIDLDGCFISEEKIIENKKLKPSPVYTGNDITTCNKEKTYKKLQNKASLIKTISQYTSMSGKDYKLFFFSLNIENAFGHGYNNNNDTKKVISDGLQKKFRDIEVFKSEISKILTSWEEVKKDTNSLKPGSNLNEILLEQE